MPQQISGREELLDPISLATWSLFLYKTQTLGGTTYVVGKNIMDLPHPPSIGLLVALQLNPSKDDHTRRPHHNICIELKCKKKYSCNIYSAQLPSKYLCYFFPNDPFWGFSNFPKISFFNCLPIVPSHVLHVSLARVAGRGV